MTWDCNLAWNASQILMCERLGVQTGTVSKLGSLWEMVLSWEDCWLSRCALKGVVNSPISSVSLAPRSRGAWLPFILHHSHPPPLLKPADLHLHGLQSSQLWAQINTFILWVDDLRYLSQWQKSDLRAICLPCNYGQLLNQCNRDINIRSMKSSFPSTAEGLTLTFNFHHMLHLVYSLIIQVMTVFPVWATV